MFAPGKSLRTALRRAHLSHKRIAVGAALTEREAANLPAALKNILKMIEDVSELDADLVPEFAGETAEQRLARRAEAYFVRVRLLIDLASKLLMEAERLDKLDVQAYIARYFSQRGMRVDLAANGSFRLTLGQVSAYLTALRQAEEMRQQSA
jgi:Asp-tRNA(Asn)/Glu-tRNA(Gln) amidotransferase C subunit